MKAIPLQFGLVVTVLLTVSPSLANPYPQITDPEISGLKIAQNDESNHKVTDLSRIIAECGSHDAQLPVRKVPPGCRKRADNVPPESNDTSSRKKRLDRIDRNGFKHSSP